MNKITQLTNVILWALTRPLLTACDLTCRSIEALTHVTIGRLTVLTLVTCEWIVQNLFRVLNLHPDSHRQKIPLHLYQILNVCKKMRQLEMELQIIPIIPT